MPTSNVRRMWEDLVMDTSGNLTAVAGQQIISCLGYINPARLIISEETFLTKVREHDPNIIKETLLGLGSDNRNEALLSAIKKAIRWSDVWFVVDAWVNFNNYSLIQIVPEPGPLWNYKHVLSQTHISKQLTRKGTNNG